MIEKKRIFAEEYVKTGNAYKSAVAAGYAESTAKKQSARMLKDPEILEYLISVEDRYKSSKVAGTEEILAFLTSVMRGESTFEQTAVVGTGNGCSEVVKVELTVSAKERVKAAELLGKRYGVWTDKVEQNTKAAVVISGEDALED